MEEVLVVEEEEEGAGGNDGRGKEYHETMEE